MGRAGAQGWGSGKTNVSKVGASVQVAHGARAKGAGRHGVSSSKAREGGRHREEGRRGKGQGRFSPGPDPNQSLQIIAQGKHKQMSSMSMLCNNGK